MKIDLNALFFPFCESFKRNNIYLCRQHLTMSFYCIHNFLYAAKISKCGRPFAVVHRHTHSWIYKYIYILKGSAVWKIMVNALFSFLHFFFYSSFSSSAWNEMWFIHFPAFTNEKEMSHRSVILVQLVHYSHIYYSIIRLFPHYLCLTFVYTIR